MTAADRGDRLPALWQMPLRSLLVSVAWTGFSWSQKGLSVPSNQWNRATVAGGLWWFHYVMLSRIAARQKSLEKKAMLRSPRPVASSQSEPGRCLVRTPSLLTAQHSGG